MASIRDKILPAVGVFLLGDRALLRPGGPGPVARALFAVKPPIYRPHPYTLYELNCDWRSADGRARHNRAGFRGNEVQVEKPPGHVRVVCMGESTTYCTGIADDLATYPARLEAHLRNARGDLDIEVINAGVGGYTSIENLLRLLFHVLPLSPDLVVHYYTHNDVHPRRMPHLSRDYREYSRSWYEPPSFGIAGRLRRRWLLASGEIGTLVRRYDEYAGRRRSANVERNPPVAFRTNMGALSLLAQHAGARVLFVNPPYRELGRNNGASADGSNLAYRAVWEHRRIVEELARETGASVYDLASEMPYPDDPKDIPNEHYLDAVHVNEQGADLMGRLIANAILKGGLLAPVSKWARG
jgi:lysophospholipase L1-like esterase